MDKPLPFYQQLRIERERRSWSQAEVAEKVGVDVKTIGRWEKGNSKPYPYYRQKLCQLFGKSAQEFGLFEEGHDEYAMAEAGSRSMPGGTPAHSTSFAKASEEEEGPGALATIFNAAPSSAKPAHRGIVGLPPPTDPRTIQQREQVVREVYTKLIQSDITAIALTGIGGVGKSTLAALIYRYVEEQRQAHTSHFLAETLWLTIDPAVTFDDLAGNLFEALGKSLPDLGNLAPQNQAVALFNALKTTEKPLLVILDQFENLLDWETGHAHTDRPGVGECLDIINSQQCACRLLLTSRPRPVGTREYPVLATWSIRTKILLFPSPS
jgi:transcriptional regulator with XRE-family HTH domain